MSWFEVSFRSALRGCGCVWFCFFDVERGVVGVGVEKQNEMRDVVV